MHFRQRHVRKRLSRTCVPPAVFGTEPLLFDSVPLHSMIMPGGNSGRTRCSGLQFRRVHEHPPCSPPRLMPDGAGPPHDRLESQCIKFVPSDVDLIKSLNLSWQGWCNLKSKERKGYRKRWDKQHGGTGALDRGDYVLCSQSPSDISAAGIPDGLTGTSFSHRPIRVPSAHFDFCRARKQCRARSRSRTPKACNSEVFFHTVSVQTDSHPSASSKA